jgi:hypothetical protein
MSIGTIPEATPWSRDLLTHHREALWRDRVVDQAEFASAELNMEYLTGAWRQLAFWMMYRA